MRSIVHERQKLWVVGCLVAWLLGCFVFCVPFGIGTCCIDSRISLNTTCTTCIEFEFEIDFAFVMDLKVRFTRKLFSSLIMRVLVLRVINTLIKEKVRKPKSEINRPPKLYSKLPINQTTKTEIQKAAHRREAKCFPELALL